MRQAVVYPLVFPPNDCNSTENGTPFLGLTIWQYRLWSFLGKDTKLERFWPKIDCSQMKLPSLENWSSIELSKNAKI